MTVRELIDVLQSHGERALDDDVVVRCEVTSSYTHDVTRDSARMDEDNRYVVVLDLSSGVDRVLRSE